MHNTSRGQSHQISRLISLFCVLTIHVCCICVLTIQWNSTCHPRLHHFHNGTVGTVGCCGLHYSVARPLQQALCLLINLIHISPIQASSLSGCVAFACRDMPRHGGPRGSHKHDGPRKSFTELQRQLEQETFVETFGEPDAEDLEPSEKFGTSADAGDTSKALLELEGGPYTLLGITLSSSIDEVRAAYKKRCLETHPDKKGGDADEFIEVQKAYEDVSRTRMVKTKNLKQDKRGPQPKSDSPIMQRYKQYQLQCQREREQEEADCRQRAHLLVEAEPKHCNSSESEDQKKPNRSSSRWSIALLPFRSAAG